METRVYANLKQGMDSFMRIAMTLRRRELKLTSISMKDEDEVVGMELVFNQNETSLSSVLNHINKMHDILNLRVYEN